MYYFVVHVVINCVTLFLNVSKTDKSSVEKLFKENIGLNFHSIKKNNVFENYIKKINKLINKLINFLLFIEQPRENKEKYCDEGYKRRRNRFNRY